MRSTAVSYRELYDDHGSKVSASAMQLNDIDQLAPDPTLPHSVRQNPGRYWLVSRAFPLQPAVIEMLVFRAGKQPKNYTAFATEGIASNAYFSTEAAIAQLNSKNNGLDEAYCSEMPLAVADAATALVSFEDEATPRRANHNVVSLVRGLGELNLLDCMSRVCSDELALPLLKLLAGREASIAALIALIGMYCKQVEITGNQLNDLLRVLVRDQHLSYAQSLLGVA